MTTLHHCAPVQCTDTLNLLLVKCTLKVLYHHLLLPRVLVSACPRPLINQWPVARCGHQFATILILKLRLEIDLHLGGR